MFDGAQRSVAAFSGSDSDGDLDLAHEDLAVSDFTGLAGPEDGFDGVFDLFVFYEDLKMELGQKINRVGAPAIFVGSAELPAVAFDLSTAQPLNAGLFQRLLHVFQLVYANVCLDSLHRYWFEA